MGLGFYIGGSGSGKSNQIYEYVISCSIKHPNTNYLIIVPDQFTMQTQKELVSMHPHGGIMNIDVLSFGRLAHRIFEEVGGNDKPILDDTGKSLLLRLVANDCKESLTVIGSNLHKIGYIHEVKSAISEFMQYGIGKSQLEELIEFSKTRGALQYKLQDLAILYDTFLEYLKDKFITTEETLDVLRSVMHQSKILQNCVIVFDGFTGFTPVQYNLIGELMSVSKELIVTVLLDGRENPYEVGSPQKLFHLSKKTIQILCEIASLRNVPRIEDVILKNNPFPRFKNNEALGHLERNLFRYSSEVMTKDQDAVQIIAMNTPKEEIKKVCTTIKNMVRENGYYYRDFAVVIGDLAGYAYHIKEQFQDFDIPYFMDQTKGMIWNPFIELIRSGLHVIRSDYKYEAVFHYLRSELIQCGRNEIDQLENYVLALGLKGKRNYEVDFTKKTRETKGDPAYLEQLNQTRQCLVTSLEVLTRKNKTAKEWVESTYDFIISNEIQGKLLQYEQRYQEQGEFTKAKEYSQIYRLVMELLEQIYALLEDEPMKIDEFIDILDAGFAEIQVGLIPQNVDRVVVGDIERTRLKEMKVLFFVGVNDGIIPKSAGKGGIISDIDREFLSESKWELAPTPRQQMYIQRLYLYMNMTKPTHQLIVSYALVNGEGKSLRPSYLIDVIKKLFSALVIQLQDESKDVYELQTKLHSVEQFSNYLREYINRNLEVDQQKEKQLFTLYHLLTEEKSNILVNKLIEHGFYHYQNNPLSKAIVDALYGKILENSVSRLELFASCAYEHFLKYGLSLQERQEYEISALDMGTMFHGVLEQFAKTLEKSQYNWFDFEKEQGEIMLDNAIQTVIADYGNDILISSSRNQYVVSRMKRILERTIHTLQYQLKKGLFLPEQFEVSFSVLEDLDSVNVALTKEEKMMLKGRIDRIDTFETDDQVYVKVIDYKSGNQSLDLVALYYGLQLQLVVYLNTALELEKKKHPEKEIVPAAFLYYHVFDPIVDRKLGEEPEKVNERLLEQLKMNGIVNANKEILSSLDRQYADGKSNVIPVEIKKDGSFTASSKVMEQEELSIVSQYVNHKIKEIGASMLQGNIEINPYEMGQMGSCNYCSYKNVCGFDPKIAGYEKRQLEQLNQETLMSKMKEGMET